MDQGGVEGLSGIPGSRTGADDHGLADCRAQRKSRQRQTEEVLGTGMFEMASAYRSHAYRAVSAVQLGEDVWVVHAFQERSTQGIKTPTREIDLVRARLKHLREMWR